jgi:hypothetical protein
MRLRKKRAAAVDAYVSGVDGLEDATRGGEQPVKGRSPSHPPDREAIENVRSRVRRGRRLGIPPWTV